MTFDEVFLKNEMNRFPHDFTIYAPAADEEHDDHGNEHLHVFRAKDGSLCALWTMSRYEGTFTQRPMFSKSFNGGLSWTTPKCLLIDPIDPETGRNMGSWASPIISKSGKIYVIYSKHSGTCQSHERGIMTVICSDDAGETWYGDVPLKLPRCPHDPDDPAAPPAGFPWQSPLRLKNGQVLIGISRNRLDSGTPPTPHPVWVEHPVQSEILRFDNLDEDPEPEDFKVTLLDNGGEGLSAPLPNHPECRSGEEPSICELPDGRLFCTMRTGEGHVWYSVSDDCGITWRETEMLRYCDGGEGIAHPLSPCPMYTVSENEYVLFVHGHDGYYGTDTPQVSGNWRNPVLMLKGEFRPHAHQPVWFSQPVEWMRNDEGVSLARLDLAMYSDLTIEHGEPVFWFPDRKFFLFGRIIPRSLLATMKVPEYRG